ncbi:unnamed protein product, partial [Mesorhabditis spiculigera]
MRNLVVFVTLLAAVITFDQLPTVPTWSLGQRRDTCKDYCMGKFIADQTAFNFLESGWEICVCPVAQEGGSWYLSSCYNNCYNRCLNTNGLCAYNQALNTDYRGRCCINSQGNAMLRNYCFNNMTGLCYQT